MANNPNARRFSVTNVFSSNARKMINGSSSDSIGVHKALEAVTGLSLKFDNVGTQEAPEYKLAEFGTFVTGAMATEKEFIQIMLPLSGVLKEDPNKNILTKKNVDASSENYRKTLEDIMNGRRKTMRAWTEIFLMEESRRCKNGWIIGGTAVGLTLAVIGGLLLYNNYRSKDGDALPCDEDTDILVIEEDGDVDTVEDLDTLEFV